MIKKMISLILFTVLSLGLFSEGVELRLLDLQIVKGDNSIDQGAILADLYRCQDCPDCPDYEGKNCRDEGECLHHCSGIHQFTAINYANSLWQKSISVKKGGWIYIHLYNPPSLDASLKPPTFS